MAAFEEEKNSTSSYKEAAKIFLSHHLPFDMDVIECVTNENIDVTRKNAQAIVNFVFSVKKGKTDIR
ncbi:hypothetical protein ACWOC1_07910 [Enterococcus quebecensis]|uniref:Uncharacterized protein n=1 Tax=Enterococcus quebecensis TaxID=903983 RepID=A0A1E5GUS9_9ENTE|nr:hypothetical protein [Enterococcus quebecensis]OEG16387.1 hypothetical protein BCR23_05715 [Enterococcus quebecensis]OJG72742.1 hypothetical protein RV12_GL000840 [Enterococcus quebecensis]